MIKILDITTSLKVGGMANGLVQTLRQLDLAHFKFAIFAGYTDPPSFTKELEGLGVEIIKSPDPYKRPACYLYALYRVLKAGDYHMVHTHNYATGGLCMMLAWLAGTKVRVVHSHNDHRTRPQAQKPIKRIYNNFMKFLIRRFATAGLAVSENSAASLYGENWKADARWQVIYGGTDFDGFEASAKGKIPDLVKPDGPCVALVGRLVYAKNPEFALKVFAELSKKAPNATFLIVGDGEMKNDLQETAKAMELQDKVIFAGMRGDVPALFAQYVDVLLLPSFHEGLPRAAVEAQAAGIPVLAADTITEECNYTGRVKFLSLDDDPACWAKVLLKMIEQGKTPLDQALTHARASHFDLQVHGQRFTEFYNAQFHKSCGG